MNIKNAVIAIMAILCGLGVPLPSADAALITIDITATVDSVTDDGPGDGWLDGLISPGSIITGSYTYESSTADSNPSSTVGHYWHYATPAGISLSVSGLDFTTDPANVQFLVGVVNDGTSGGLHDSYWIYSYNNLSLSNGPSVDAVIWALEDPTASALSTDALPTSPPVLDDWQSVLGLRLEGEKGGYFVDATVTSAVPEPATILLLAIGTLTLRKRKRTIK
jgi:hypothetical protein